MKDKLEFLETLTLEQFKTKKNDGKNITVVEMQQRGCSTRFFTYGGDRKGFISNSFRSDIKNIMVSRVANSSTGEMFWLLHNQKGYAVTYELLYLR